MRSTWPLASAAVLTMALSAAGAGQRFYPDDPIRSDPETQDASRAQPVDVSDAYDLIENSFLGAGDKADIRAVNVNTVDEVPDSSWFTNRIRRDTPMTLAELAKGPDTRTGPAAGPWTVTSRKSEGVMPGFTIRDTAGDTYWIKLDPASNPEMASGAEVISTKFFHAFGYHVPENYVATLNPATLVIDPEATMKDEDGRPRRMTRHDVDAILANAARNQDGTYRVLASLNLPGRPLGPFRYYGTRPDDPNDIFPHEHRRELRGLSVFAAWVNHDEVRSSNSLDTMVSADGRQAVRHYLLDFGSTLGSGSVKAQSRRAGNEFVWESRPTLITMLTLGFYVRPWLKVDYPKIPSVGRFESSYFQPDSWKPDYPNPAFKNARADDRFWAARIVAAFSDEAIQTIVGTAKYTDPNAYGYLVETLIERRKKILERWLNGLNPVVDLALDSTGRLTFRNAAEAAGAAKPAERYSIAWARFDNATDTHTSVGTATTVTERVALAPPELLESPFISVTIKAHSAEHPEWERPLVAYFRRNSSADWTLVGLERTTPPLDASEDR